MKIGGTMMSPIFLSVCVFICIDNNAIKKNKI